MKIIQLIQKPQRRGAEIFAAQLSEGLTCLGHEIILVSVFEGYSAIPFSGKFLKLNRKTRNRFWDFYGWKVFSKIVKDFNPDFVQANAADTLKFSVFSKALFNWKSPIVYRNANQMGDFIQNGFHRSFNQGLLNSVSGIVSVSNASHLDLENTFNVKSKKMKVIPIGIDFDEILEKLTHAHSFTLPESFIIQVGGLVPEKRPLEMLDIFSRNRKLFPELSLVFLGSGPLKEKLIKKIQDKGLEANVFLFPNQENIYPILSKAKALVMPSSIEGLPAVLLEAMYCKVPVIASNVGGISELVDSNTGWLIEKDDFNSFGQAIKSIIQGDEEVIKEITESAFEKVSDFYSINVISSLFDQYFKSF